MDIGSNTVRVLVAEGHGWDMRRLFVKRRITRLGGKFNGNLDPESMTRTLEAAKEFSLFAKSQGASEIRVGCTGVLRKAGNREVFFEDLRREAGLEPVLLPGETEANLAALGTRHHLGPDFPEFLLIDIGGFSTELACVGEKVGRRASFDVGVVSLTEEILTSDPPTPGQIERMSEIVADRFRGFFGIPVPKVLVGIAGTPTTLAVVDMNLGAFDPKKIHRHTLSVDKIEEISDRLLGMTSLQRLEAYPGLEKGREDLIPAGIVIAREAMKAGGFDSIVVSTGSILDGMLMTETWPPE